MFSDVFASRWSYKSIEAVAKAGLMGGFPDGTFRPEEPLTREQMASILHRQMFRDGLFVDVLPEAVQSVVTITSSCKLGSGACVACRDGWAYVLTNAHVVSNKDGSGYEQTFTLTLHDGSTVAAIYHIASAVPGEDLALVKALADIPPLPVSAEPAVLGEPVAVIGSPLGLRESVTVGVISSADRDGGTRFQLDAAINPGNSGGPIINERGELVGVSVAKVVDVAVEGICFGVSLKLVKQFLERTLGEV